MKRFLLPVFGLWLCCLLLSACGSSTPEPTITATPSVRPSPVVGTGTGDIKIGLIAPLTGPYAPYGTAVRRGILLALEDLKPLRGPNARKITLIERDDRADPAAALINFQDLVEKERVVALFGGVNDEVAQVLAPLAAQWRIPLIMPVATTRPMNSVDPAFIFRLAVPLTDQTSMMANYARQKGFSRVALVSDSAKLAQENRKNISTTLKNSGLTPAFDNTLYPEDRPEDRKTFTTNLIEAQPDLLYYWGTNGILEQLAGLLAEQKIDYPVMGGETLALPGVIRSLPPTFDTVLLPQTFLSDGQNSRQQDFVNRYRRLFNTDQLDFPGGTAQSYDAARLLGEAFKQTGSADNRETLRDALEGIDEYDGLLKTYNQPWKAGGNHEALIVQDLMMCTWKNGKLVKAP